jgi:CheY-like chemotaxis protein
LATVYGVVQQHNGFIHVYSEPGVGSTFRVYLPASSERDEGREAAVSPEVPGGTECILIAEDHQDMREMVEEILAKAGYSLLVASNGREAVRLFESQPGEIALVILDVIMPELGGPDAYEEMCARRPGLPVIFVSGYSTEVDRTKVQERGFAFLQKPYDPRSLKSKIREVLGRAN